MSFDDLELLVAVVRLGSFAAAARERNVDPSSVSRVVAGLEAELGVRLFQRSTRQLALTEAGAGYAQRMAPLLEEMRLARQALSDAGGQVRGRLRVSVSNTFGLRQLLPRLPAFAAHHPALEIDLLMTDAVVDLMAERVDVAVRLGPLRDSSLVAVPLMDIDYRVVASPAWIQRQAAAPDNPSQMSTAGALCFALAGFRDCWRFAPRAGGPTLEVPIQPRLQTTNGLALCELALAGVGPTLLPGWLVDNDVRAGRLVDLYPQHVVAVSEAPGGAWIVYPSRSYVPAKVRVFIEFLRESVTVSARTS
jgi:DNA-binding transcriptional LysR family regulator